MDATPPVGHLERLRHDVHDETRTDELHRLSLAGSELGVIDWCRRLGLVGLRHLRADIVALAASNPFDNQAADRRVRQQSALAVALLASAPTAPQAASALDQWPGQMNVDDVVGLLMVLAPRWLAQLPERALASRWGQHWRLAHALVREGLVARPHDPRYIDQMIFGLDQVYSSLRDDPSLIDGMWSFFESDTRGLLLNGRDTTDSRSDAAAVSEPPEQRLWSEALARLAAEGAIDTGRLLQAALDALAMEAPWRRLTWYAALIERLEPTGDHVVRFWQGYLRLFGSSTPEVVSFAQRMCASALIAGGSTPVGFLDVAAAALFAPDASVALAQLKLLATVAEDPMWRDRATFVIAEALGHADLEVRQVALALVDRLAPTVSAACRQHVADRRALVEPPAADGHLAQASMSPGSDELRFDDEPIGPPLDDDSFVHVIAELMDRSVHPLVLDQAIEAALRVCGYPPRLQRSMVIPLVGRAAAVECVGPAGRWASDCVLVMSGGERRRERLGGSLVDLLLDEVLDAVERRTRRAYLALPTHRSGRIDPREHLQRFRSFATADESIRPGPVETLVARLRSDSAGDVLTLSGVSLTALTHGQATPVLVASATARWGEQPASPRVLPDSPDGAVRMIRLESEDELEREHAVNPAFAGSDDAVSAATFLAPKSAVLDATSFAWWLSLLPQHPDLAVVHVLHSIADITDHEPSSSNLDLLRPILERYRWSHISLGQVGPVAIALGLGAKSASIRSCAVDVIAFATAREPDAIVRTAARTNSLVDAGVLKLSRVGEAVSELGGLDPRLARDFAIHVLARHAVHRDAHRLMAIVADSIVVAGPTDLPIAIYQLAESTGMAQGTVHARALVRLVPRVG